MACNCKNTARLLKNGTMEEEGIFSKCIRKVSAAGIYAVLGCIAVISTPFVALYTAVSILVRGKVVLPFSNNQKSSQ